MVQLNMAVEPLVREAFAAAVARDPGRSAEALRAMADGGDATVQDSVNLATLVAAFALRDLNGGQRPDDADLQRLAGSFVEMNEWAEFDPDTVRSVLTALADQRSVEGELPAQEVARLIFVLGVWLMAAFGPDERHWWQYLDQILDALESAAETSR